MITIEKIETYGWEAAIRGMRNPMNSWDKSDSYPSIFGDDFHIGDEDFKLMKNLVSAGTDHSKFMRQIGVSMDVTAPLYWWKEFDTYKVGTTANSCSTMHKIHEKGFEITDFSHDHLTGDAFEAMNEIIAQLNFARVAFLETKDKAYWWEMIQLLPSSYNQKRTVTLNYSVLRNQYHARKSHKLDEWRLYCECIETLLPYSELITM